MEEDLKMAREIQQTMLPQQYPTFPKDADPRASSFRFCHRYYAHRGPWAGIISASWRFPTPRPEFLFAM